MNAVLTYIFGNGELLRDPVVITPNTQYFVITDNNNIKSHIWNPIVVPRIKELSVRDQVAAVKFNPFIIPADKYLIIDSSHQIIADLQSLFDKIGPTSMCVKRHPKKVDIDTEIGRWRAHRDLTATHERNFRQKLMSKHKLSAKLPIFEGCFIGISNSDIHKKIFYSTLYHLHLLRDVSKWFPSNQVVLSYFEHLFSNQNKLIQINPWNYSIRYQHNTWKAVKE